MKAIINQLFEIQQKCKKANIDVLDRNISRINHELESMGYLLLDPTGEKYSETRMDIEANIMDGAAGQLTITKVLKPVIYKIENNERSMIQKGIVIVE